MKKAWIGKLRKENGESLAETMAAMLITCMGLLILLGAILAAARVNQAARDADLFLGTGETLVTGCSLVLSDGSGGSVDISASGKVDIYQSPDGEQEKVYYYYVSKD